MQEAEERARLREAEMELVPPRKIFPHAHGKFARHPVAFWTAKANVVYKSPSVKSVLGYDPEELRGAKSFSRMSILRICRSVQEAFQTALDNPEQTITIQFRYQHKDGEWRRLERSGKTVWLTRKSAAIVANCRDVTDRWRAEEELRDSEKQYRLLFHSNPNPMWVFDLETQKFLEVNEAAIQHYGYSREEFLAMTIMDIRPPEKDRQHKTIARMPRTAGLSGGTVARTAA